jgi:hypothetical protein
VIPTHCPGCYRWLRLTCEWRDFHHQKATSRRNSLGVVTWPGRRRSPGSRAKNHDRLDGTRGTFALDLALLVGLVAAYGLGAFALAVGVRQFRRALVGPPEDLSLGRFRWLSLGPRGKRWFWLLGGTSLAIHGVGWLAVTTSLLVT